MCGVAKQLLSYKCDDFASRGTGIQFPQMEDFLGWMTKTKSRFQH